MAARSRNVVPYSVLHNLSSADDSADVKKKRKTKTIGLFEAERTFIYFRLQLVIFGFENITFWQLRRHASNINRQTLIDFGTGLSWNN